MFNFDFYSIFYDILAYIIAARSLIDEVLYKLGFKRSLDFEKDLPSDLRKVVAIVTGGTRGLGLTVVRELLARGANVYVATSQKPQLYPKIEAKIYEEVASVNPEVKLGKAFLRYLDLSSLKSVSNFTQSIKNSLTEADSSSYPTHIICNAGIMFAPRELTEDFLESHFAINYLGHCLLILELLPLLQKKRVQSVDPRIISVSSSTHHITKFRFDDLDCATSYSASQAYAQSKLAQIMFSYKLSKMLRDRVKVFSLHPGVILSDLYEHVKLIKYFPILIPLIKLVTRNMVQGAETILYATLSRDLKSETGLYLEDCEVKTPSLAARNEADQDRLWEVTLKLLSPYLTETYSGAGDDLPLKPIS